jgi:hypothetical protein
MAFNITKSSASVIIHANDSHHLSYVPFFRIEHIGVSHISDP